MNYSNRIENGPVCENLYAVARERHGEKISIDWLSPENSSKLPIDVEAAVNAHRRTLDAFLKQHDVARSALSDFCTEIFSDTAHQIHIMGRVVDDRGRTHRFRIKI